MMRNKMNIIAKIISGIFGFIILNIIFCIYFIFVMIITIFMSIINSLVLSIIMYVNGFKILVLLKKSDFFGTSLDTKISILKKKKSYKEMKKELGV